ncbi:MAG: hypothetical protein CML12_00785 [Puniceicoccaceae bacterium]|nr:hypothetical protein [Puniceicoccaceae bacterium]
MVYRCEDVRKYTDREGEKSLEKVVKICHVLADKKSFGGIQKHVFSLAEIQLEMGDTVSILLNTELVKSCPSSITPKVCGLNRSRFNPFLWLELLKALSALDPDIIHLHGRKVGYIFNFIKHFIKQPIVVTVHNTRKPVIKNEQFVFICVSKLAQTTSALKNSTIIYNAIDAPDSLWSELARERGAPFLNEGNPILYSCGRFVKAKGFDLLVDALADIPQARLWLVGEGEEWKKIHDQVVRLGLENRVWMPGHLDADHTVGLMALADLFVISSRREGGPFTLSEALRSHCPVVASPVGFVPEFLSTEQIFESIDVQSMKLKLRSILSDLVNYRASFEPIFKRADNELDLGVMAKKVKAVYESTM